MLNKTVSLIDMIKLSHNIELSKPYIQYLCGLDKAGTYHHQEILDIQSLLTEVNLPEESVSGFLYGYVVPQLNREFDLLRISQSGNVNIISYSHRNTGDRSYTERSNRISDR